MATIIWWRQETCYCRWDWPAVDRRSRTLVYLKVRYFCTRRDPVIERDEHVWRPTSLAPDHKLRSTQYAAKSPSSSCKHNQRLILKVPQRKRAEDAPEASTSTARSTRSSTRTAKSTEAPAPKKTQPAKRSTKKATVEISSDEVRGELCQFLRLSVA